MYTIFRCQADDLALPLVPTQEFENSRVLQEVLNFMESLIKYWWFEHCAFRALTNFPIVYLWNKLYVHGFNTTQSTYNLTVFKLPNDGTSLELFALYYPCLPAMLQISNKSICNRIFQYGFQTDWYPLD